jgi:2-aminoadipate transaminase
VAWVDAPAPLAAKLEFAKQAEDLSSGVFDQRIVYEACHRGIVDRQLPILRAHYQHKRDVMVDALKSAFDTTLTWPAPRGGFFLWATLPSPLDANALLARAVEHGVIFVAGDAFYVNDEPSANVIRLSFSAPAPDRINEGVARLKRAIQQESASLTAAARSGSSSRAAP